jgi:signal transduction histidine kinase
MPPGDQPAALLERLAQGLATGDGGPAATARMALDILAGRGWLVEADPWNPAAGMLAVTPLPGTSAILHRMTPALAAAGLRPDPPVPRLLGTAAHGVLPGCDGPSTILPLLNRAIPTHATAHAPWGWLVIPGDHATAADLAAARAVIQLAIDAALERQVRGWVMELSPHPINYHAGQERRWSNAAQEAFIGFSAEVIRSDPRLWGRISHPEDQREQDRLVASLWRGEASGFNLDKRYTLPDGRTVWGRNSYHLVRDSHGRPALQISYLFDLTRIKEAEAAAADALAEAKRALEVRSSFLANASHEMRTPLHGILSALELLDEPCTADERRALLDTMGLSARLLLRLVNDVLELARVESDGFRLHESACDLRALARSLSDAMRPLLQPGVALAWSCDEAVPRVVLADQDRLRQILLNLMGNAAKFTPTGHIALAISSAGPRTRFAVSDTGIGMDSERPPRWPACSSAAADSAWRSCAAWSTAWAAPWRWTARRAMAPRSVWNWTSSRRCDADQPRSC